MEPTLNKMLQILLKIEMKTISSKPRYFVTCTTSVVGSDEP